MNALTLVGNDDDDSPTCPAPSPLASEVEFAATAGVVYRVAVAGRSGSSSDFQLFVIPPPPPNDNFASAEVLVNTVNGRTVSATREPGEPVHFDAADSGSIWYNWTAPTTGTYRVHTCDSAANTVLAVYTGASLGSLTLVGNDNDGASACPSSPDASEVYVAAVSGTMYRIAIAGFEGAWADTTVSVELAPAPANDNFADAATLGSSAAGSTANATREAGEPTHWAGDDSGSLWYNWAAPLTGTFTMATCGSEIDTVLAVYTGTAVNVLTLVAADDNDAAACPASTQLSQVSFAAVAGQVYRVAVAGRSGAQGNIALVVIAPPPANDDFANAATLTTSASSTTLGATRQAGEPEHLGPDDSGSVWFNWTPPTTGVYRLTTCGSAISNGLAVYTGTAVDSLALVGVAGATSEVCPTDPLATELVVLASAGTVYRIALVGQGGQTGPVQVNVAQPPPNDNFVDGTMITTTGSGSNVDATRELNEPGHGVPFQSGSIWFRWTAPASGGFQVNTCGSDFDTVLAIYTGNAVGALTSVASGNNGSSACPSTPAASEVLFTAIAGTVYHIAVAGYGTATGSVQVNVASQPAPPNDNFASATVLTGFGTGTNVSATRQPGEPQHIGPADSGSVWWTFTPWFTGRHRVQTCANAFDTVLAVYTGTAVDALTLVASDDNTGGNCGGGSPGASLVEFEATAGVAYYIAVAGAGGATGQYYNITFTPPPFNNRFADASTLFGTGVSTNELADREPGEPVHLAAGESGSVWFNWTAPASVPVSLNTCGSAIDTGIAVYTGSDVASLTLVAADDDGASACPGSPLLSEVSFTAVAGTTYRISLVGKAGAEGFVWVNVVYPPPANDNFADAISVTTSATGTTLGATREAGEPLPFNQASQSGSVWYTWTSPTSGAATINTCGSSIDTILAVYTGSAVNSLTLVAQDDQNNTTCPASPNLAEVVFAATQGTTYRIAVSGFGLSTGDIAINILPPSLPMVNINFSRLSPSTEETASQVVSWSMTFTEPVAPSFTLDDIDFTGDLAPSVAVSSLTGTDPTYVLTTGVVGENLEGFLGFQIPAGAVTGASGGGTNTLNGAPSFFITESGALPGDINNDEVVNVADVTALADHIVNGTPLP